MRSLQSVCALARRAAFAAAAASTCLWAQPAHTETAQPPAKAVTPARVVTLAPHITEMVFAAGAGHTLVGTVQSSNYPEAARSLPKVGDGAASINTEALIRLQPSLVLAWQPSGATAALNPVLQRLEVPLEFLAPARLDDIPDQIEALGMRLGSKDKAGKAASTLRAALLSLNGRYAHRPPVSVFIEVGHSPLYAIGNDDLLNDALRVCGGINIFQDSRMAALPINPERILQKRPDVILTAAQAPGQKEEVQARWTALGLSPSTGTHIHAINPDTLFRPGPRLVAATEQLCRLLESARTNKH